MPIPAKRDVKYYLFLIVFLIVIVMFIRLLLPFIAPLILAPILVSVFTPIFAFLVRHKLPRAVSSFVCCGLICVIIFIPFLIIIYILAGQAMALYSSAMNSEKLAMFIQEVDGNYIVTLVNSLLERIGINFTISGSQLYDIINQLGRSFGKFLYEQAASLTGNFIKIIISFFFMILICYYLFGNGRRVMNFFVGLSPLPEGHEEQVLRRMKNTAGAIFVGSGVSGLIQGSIGGITFWVFGFPAPFLWAVVMVILAFLPIVGIGLVFVPAIVLTFVAGNYMDAVIMAIIYIAASSITEYIIVPKIEGKQSRMPTVLVFLSVIGGLQLFGIIGVLYGPLIITAFLALYEIYKVNYIYGEEDNCPPGSTPAPQPVYRRPIENLPANETHVGIADYPGGNVPIGVNPATGKAYDAEIEDGLALKGGHGLPFPQTAGMACQESEPELRLNVNREDISSFNNIDGEAAIIAAKKQVKE